MPVTRAFAGVFTNAISISETAKHIRVRENHERRDLASAPIGMVNNVRSPRIKPRTSADANIVTVPHPPYHQTVAGEY